eukprot:TRINITY_DN2418_c0_g1_i2.p2 TRINITY_DN2418_c0_g1~~TRINITY_DN2418_c0_g1_i2.p2  ORF type:complete len:111 (+),score=21.89 TRINITY_DN2418_c0_g1_i2:72-404(+)
MFFLIIRRPPRSTLSSSSAASDVYKRQVQEGQLVAMKVMKPGQEAIEVFSYKAGDYFGELAILKNQPRQASIVCKSDVVLVSLDRFSFQRMLGPVEEILKRNIDRYKKYM